MAAGEEVFKTNCISCHGEGAKGGIGPNLTV
ncbi:c-type cytochrome [Halpernia sp. GG3]